jgi:hypothetical protein
MDTLDVSLQKCKYEWEQIAFFTFSIKKKTWVDFQYKSSFGLFLWVSNK